MVRWTKPAKTDLKQIYDYIARDSKFYAKKISSEIVEKSEILNSFPEAGRIVPELGMLNVRELLIYSYRLIYEVFPGKVEVLALIHGRRDFTRGFLDGQRHEKN